MQNTVEPPLTDTFSKRTLGHVLSYIQTQTTFLTSHKRTPLLNGHFLWFQGCPLKGGSTVQKKKNTKIKIK